MFLGDLGDTDIHKQHDAALMEMTACLFISSRDQVTMHGKQQLKSIKKKDKVISLKPLFD